MKLQTETLLNLIDITRLGLDKTQLRPTAVCALARWCTTQTWQLMCKFAKTYAVLSHPLVGDAWGPVKQGNYWPQLASAQAYLHVHILDEKDSKKLIFAIPWLLANSCKYKQLFKK